jgi:2-polyprenyl-6-methoxyphenol hydroxylase-like FAD-dependent oxidoreductase
MPEAIIVGGGLAGTATALALHRAGLGASVHESAASSAQDVGAWLTLAGNGMDALATLGLADEVAAAGFPTPRMSLRTGDGRELLEFASGAPRPDGLQAQTIRRPDLYRVLRDAVGRVGVPISYGHRLVGVDHLAGGRLRARFADGSETTGDLLVGADGLRSRTRQLIDPAGRGARYIGLLNVGGYARGLDLGRPPGVLDFCFGRRCFLGYVTSPDGDVWWFTNPPSPEPARGELASLSETHWRARLTGLFADDALPVRALLDASEELFAGWPTYDIPKVRTWHRDGMVLVGDAVHAASPASGQGASMAFEDAVTLARCLRDRPSTADAFVTYERLRRRRVEAVVARGKRTGDAKAPGPVGRWVRDRLVMPLVAASMRRAGPNRDEWLTGHHIDWDSPVAA